jgi:phage terminase large subunit
MTTQNVSLGYAPRPQFKPFHRRRQRWSCMITHRRAGKTTACLMDMVGKAMDKPGGRYAYIAPLRNQAKTVAWDMLKKFAAEPIRSKPPNEAELYVEITTLGTGSAAARITLFGADNPDALRGQAFDGVVLDEYADMPPSLMGSVVRPALTDRRGFCTIVGTVKGRNQLWEQYSQAVHDRKWYTAFLRASQTHLLPEAELADARRQMSPEQYASEFECDPYAAIQGAYYGSYLNQLEAREQIGQVPCAPILPVHTAWDLGIGDSTAIWFWQAIGGEIRVIDYYENHGKGLDHYVAELEARQYRYGKDFVPHDAHVRELGTGKTRVETLVALGREPAVIPRHTVADGINAVRLILPNCWFDAEKCHVGLEALRQYQAEYNDKKRDFSLAPRHDWTSHAADAFRYMAQAYQGVRAEEPPEPRRNWNKPLHETSYGEYAGELDSFIFTDKDGRQTEIYSEPVDRRNRDRI